MTKAQKQAQEEAIKALRVWIKPGDKLYTILRHVSKSGMSRTIQVVKPTTRLDGDQSMLYLGYLIAKACGYRYDQKREGIVIGGCGMDMGYAIIHDLGRTLFPEGGDLSLSPREAQERRAGETRETDGGYLLRHEWL